MGCIFATIAVAYYTEADLEHNKCYYRFEGLQEFTAQIVRPQTFHVSIHFVRKYSANPPDTAQKCLKYLSLLFNGCCL